MRFRPVALAIVFCLSSSWLLGQAGAAADAAAPASPEEIRKLFDVMQVHDQMKLMMQGAYQQMRAMQREEIKKEQPDVTDEDIAKVDAISEEVLKRLSVEGLLEDMIPVYQKHLTKADVDAMVAFYSTPTGQKILREMPAMMSEGMQAMQPRLRKMVDEASAEMEKRWREQMEEKKSAPAKPNTVKN